MSHFPPFKHLAYINQLRSEIKQPLRYNLSDSCGETLTVGQLLAMGDEQGFLDLNLGYASIQGAPALREQIRQLHHLDDANQVVTFCGAQEALFALYNQLLRPGDEVIVLSPAYPSLLAMGQQLGAVVKPVELTFERGWQFGIEDITAQLSDKTRLIVLNSPHNPTGAVMSKDLAQQILTLASDRGIYLISDEVSIWSNHSGPTLNYPFLDYDRAIVVGVMSKSFGLPGVRIGWAVSRNQPLLQRLMEIRGYLSICGSASDEWLATIALTHRETLLQRNNQLIKTNIALFAEFIAAHDDAFAWHPPQAGIMTLVKYKLETPIHQLAKRLAHEQQTLILPGDLFNIPGNYFRLGLGRENFSEALKGVRAELEINRYIS